MSWSESDLISFLELNPELKEILDGKLDRSEYDLNLATLKSGIAKNETGLNNHIQDKVIHITDDERTYWNSIEAKAKQYMDDKADELYAKSNAQLNTLTDTVNSHVTNQIVHITNDERDKWNSAQQNAIDTSKAYTDEREEYLKNLIQSISRNSDEAIELLRVSMNAHINDKDIHVTYADKKNWDNAYTNSTDYSDKQLNNKLTPVQSTMNAHIGDSTIHVTPSDKAKWNSAESNADRYTDNKILTLQNTMNTNISTLKSADSSLDNKISTLSNNLDSKVSSLQTTDASLLRMINSLNTEPTTVNGGIRLSMQSSAPSSPKVNKELWLNTSNGVLYYYSSSGWISIKTIYG